MYTFYRFVWLLAAAAFLYPVHAQVGEGGTPPSFRHEASLRSVPVAGQIPVTFNVEDLKTVDAWQASQGAPLKVARLIPVEYSIGRSGDWTTLPDGETICQLSLQAEGAIALMVYYKRFYIPEGGRLFLYNSNKTQVLGAYTHRTNPAGEAFATEFVAGDELVFEYVAGAGDRELPQIEISEIGYGYNHLTVENSPYATKNCLVNINCDEGQAWQTEKLGVCRMVQRIGNSSYLCSGSLVNNTAQDLKPYILSAYHCTESELEQASASDYGQFVFYFNYELTGCDDNSLPAVSQTMVGCTRVAYTPINGGSDGLLLLLNQQIPDSYNVYYNGWDRSNTAATSGVGIHHPGGVYKKISTFSQTANSATWADEDKNQGAARAHWNVFFDATTNGHSVPEGGSSGSPLFNQNKLVVGTLSGGTSSCDEPDGYNFYGKLYYHWNQYSDKDTCRMDIWLDPSGTGVSTLAGRYRTEQIPSPSNLTLAFTDNTVVMNWTAPAGNTRPSGYKIYRNNQSLASTTSLTYTDAAPPADVVTYGVSATYSGGTESPIISASVYVTEYLAPENVSTATDEEGQVSVTWDPPVYTQTIYWGTGNVEYMMGFSGTPFYFGQGWLADDIAAFDRNLLRGIQFVPTGGAYSLLVKQGDRSYTQKLTGLTEMRWNTIALTTPFAIDGGSDLIISLYAYDYIINRDTLYPAVCDEGPAINGKGNLFSADGSEWFYLYDLNESYDSNFALTAIVTSEEGTITKSLPASGGKLNLKPYTDGDMLKTKATSDVPSAPNSQLAAPFPAITGYNIYRDGRKINASAVTASPFSDANLSPGTYSYAVSALYGTVESALTTAGKGTIVSTESLSGGSVRLTPNPFSHSVTIHSDAEVTRLEILSVGGQLVRRIDRPGKNIDTGSLPAGVYLFRLTTGEEVKVFKMIK